MLIIVSSLVGLAHIAVIHFYALINAGQAIMPYKQKIVLAPHHCLFITYCEMHHYLPDILAPDNR